jgi:XTP/dITP diphosphohydrolase
MKLVIATANAHKLHEIAEMLREVPGVELLSLRDFPTIELPPETGATMPENARIKAEYCLKVAGLPALADDSGIEVDALGGEPGVYSARWVEGSDADRTAALLQRVNESGDSQRTARYRCAICLATPDGRIEATEGTCEGRIAHEPNGVNGFGYDPIFEITAATGAPAEWVGRTMAEAPPEIKASVSHRARGVAAMVPVLTPEVTA